MSVATYRDEHLRNNETATDQWEEQFRRMHIYSRTVPPPDFAARKALLSALNRRLSSKRFEFCAAIARDFGTRSAHETMMAEVLPSMSLISSALRHLGSWMKPERRPTALHFLPGRNRIIWQPKGVVLIIAPWNYPLYLAVAPLVSALAAGNRVILKPSEMTPETSLALKQHIEAVFAPDRVQVAIGGIDVAQMLCRLPFDHILFTGSTGAGREVMRAAAEHLTSVTLELGGKSPAILHDSFDFNLAARRIARGKLINAGQTCIAPDYVLVPRNRLDEFVAQYRAAAAALYPRIIENPDYASVVDARNFDRLTGLVEDARAKGAMIEIVDPARELRPTAIGVGDKRKVAPLLLTGVSDDMRVSQEEIFGPILPVLPYDGLDDAITYVNSRARPLALYYFDTNGSRLRDVLARTTSGGATVNDTLLHIAQDALPFGGIGPSGMGSYHGVDGFRTFSHAKAIFYQSRFAASDFLSPPFGKTFDQISKLMLWRFGTRN
jgi:coniferyl-aldehyde dehydrogenase